MSEHMSFANYDFGTPDTGSPFAPPPGEDGLFFSGAAGQEDYENEPPLLEELGINFGHIRGKTIAVLNPIKRNIDPEVAHDSDLAGPFVFALLLGSTLLLRGKWTFDYIYGFTGVGCIALYFLVNVMAMEPQAEVDIYQTVSILGYCLLPMVFLALTTLFFPPSGVIGGSVAVLIVLWCTYSASYLFCTPHMMDKKSLIGYPLFLFYACFALLTIF